MPTWVIRADRRASVYDAVADEIREVAASVDGLTLFVVARDEWEEAAPAAGFRDFAEIARMTHPAAEALQWAAEELVGVLGWRVDVSAQQEEVDARGD